jgi:hypothetical protein
MRANQRHFDDHLVRNVGDKRRGLSPGGDSSKVRNGVVGEHRHMLTDALQAELDAIWRQTLGAKFGFESYQDLRAALTDVAQ